MAVVGSSIENLETLNNEGFSDNDDAPEEAHRKLLKAVTQLYKKQRIEAPKRREAAQEISEFNLTSNLEEKSNKINVNELLSDLKKRVTHKEIDKKVKEVLKKSQTLPKPLEKNEAEQIRRAVGYDDVKNKLDKWNAVVERNRVADQLIFPLRQKPIEKEPVNFLTTFEKPSELEKAMAEVLQQSGAAHEERETENELSKLSIDEMIDRRRMMARLKARESYRIAKAVRQNRIKSKQYHRVLKKEKIKKQMEEFEKLKLTDPEKALEMLEELERARAKERISLRHRNTGKWAQSQVIRSKYDREARAQLADQLAKSRELTQKLRTSDDSDSDSAVEEMETGSEEDDSDDPQKSESSNPWLNEFSNFIKGYEDFSKETEANKSRTIKSSEKGSKDYNVSVGGDRILVDDQQIVSDDTSLPCKDNTETSESISACEEVKGSPSIPSKNIDPDNTNIPGVNSSECLISTMETNNSLAETPTNCESSQGNDKNIHQGKTSLRGCTEDSKSGNTSDLEDLEKKTKIISPDDSINKPPEILNEKIIHSNAIQGNEQVLTTSPLKLNEVTSKNITPSKKRRKSRRSLPHSQDMATTCTPDILKNKPSSLSHLHNSVELALPTVVPSIKESQEDQNEDILTPNKPEFVTNISPEKAIIELSENFNISGKCKVRHNSPKHSKITVEKPEEGIQDSPSKLDSSCGTWSVLDTPVEKRTVKRSRNDKKRRKGSLSSFPEVQMLAVNVEPVMQRNLGNMPLDTSPTVNDCFHSKQPLSGENIDSDVTSNSDDSDEPSVKKRSNKSLHDLFDEAEEAIQSHALKASVDLSCIAKSPVQKKKFPKQESKKQNRNHPQRPRIDEGLIEVNEEGISCGASSVKIIKERLESEASKKDQEKQEPQIDPNQHMKVKPQKLLSEIGESMGGGDYSDEEEEDSQKMHLMEAFADDDIAADFMKEKKEEAKKSKEQVINLSLPGWGSWGGTNIAQNNRKRKGRLIVKLPKVPRKDHKKLRVIINEDVNPALKQKLVSDLPYPFSSVKEYEASIRAPIGKTWVPERAFKKLIAPPVITKLGTIIEPMSEDTATQYQKASKRKRLIEK